jgi:hypothetical protein
MLYKSSAAHMLFNELSPQACDMLRCVLSGLVSGKTELDHFYRLQNLWIPYLERYYSLREVQKFYNIMQSLDIIDLEDKPRYEKYN